MNSTELTDSINRALSSRGAQFVFGAETIRIPGAMISINGSIDGHPVRFNFSGPDNVAEGVYVVWVFDPRTKNQIGDASAPSGFPAALERMDWSNLLGALTH
ncbi:hypothetical protein [Agreia sp. COWG]|uniref:hypothetical protein n=1 Tax=Agreia sp. COWG TaxID=2773266 RepID=UPI0019293E36|nr:hypothetical protein [Agreia sp. COWG]